MCNNMNISLKVYNIYNYNAIMISFISIEFSE